MGTGNPTSSFRNVRTLAKRTLRHQFASDHDRAPGGRTPCRACEALTNDLPSCCSRWPLRAARFSLLLKRPKMWGEGDCPHQRPIAPPAPSDARSKVISRASPLRDTSGTGRLPRKHLVQGFQDKSIDLFEGRRVCRKLAHKFALHLRSRPHSRSLHSSKTPPTERGMHTLADDVLQRSGLFRVPKDNGRR